MIDQQSSDQYFSAKELAGVDGMPGTERAVQLKAKKEAWPFRRRVGRGGGREYLLSALPMSTRMALAIEIQKESQPTLPATAKIIPLYNKEGIRPELRVVRPEEKAEKPTFAPVLSLQGAAPGNAQSPDWAVKISLARVDLVRAFVAEREAARLKKQGATEAAREFVMAYNAGVILPGLQDTLGRVALSTLYLWEKTFRESSYDFHSLIPDWGNARRGSCKLTEDEKNYILSFCLHQNQIKVMTAINLTKHLLERRGIPSPSHPDTIRRFVKKFQAVHYDKWTLAREGEKALRDKVAPYLERNDLFLEVGDVLVGDGHRCNFKVINPFTGKPCRPSLIGFFDWASRVMVGWSIMLEENVQAISAALRKAILNLGKIPKYTYLDNGKAFKAKIFTSDIDLEECGVYGMFVRLGIHTCFAWPYNARSKPIERFFGTLSDTFERLLPSFCGSSIENKPASLLRNEKYMQGLFPQRMPDIREVNGYLHNWQNYYLQMPHPNPSRRGADGKRFTRGDVFSSGRGQGVDPQELTYLMMSMEIKTVRQNGVTFLGRHYWNENLYGLKDRVVMKYDLGDLTHVYLYDRNGEFLGRADRVEPVHPMAVMSENSAEDYSAVQEGIKKQRALVRDTKKIVKMATAQGRKEAIDQLPWNEMIQVVPSLPEKIEQFENELHAQDQSPDGVQYFEEITEENELIAVEPETELPKPETEPRFEFPYERYEWLMEKSAINPEDRQWMDDYRAGKIAPGEWRMIFGEKTATGDVAIYD